MIMLPKSKFNKVIAHMLVFMMIFTGASSFCMFTATSVHGLSKICKVKTSSLNVRSGAGTSYKKVGTLKKGKYRIVKSSKKDSKGVTWYKVDVNSSKSGYVSSKYVNIISLSVTSLSNTTGTVNVSSGTLTARSGPGTVFKSVGSVSKGKKLTVTGKAKDVTGVYWYRFKHNGSDAYASSKYIKISSTSSSAGTTSSTTSSSSTTNQYTVTTLSNTKGRINISSGSLTVRSGPGTSYSSLGSLSKDQVVTLTGKATVSGTTWYQLSYNGSKGFISSSYVTIENDSSSSGTSSSGTSFKIGTVKTSASSLNVRKGAGTSYSILGTIANGTVVTILGSAKDGNGTIWYKYQYSKSTVGYISSAYVTIKTVTTDSNFETYMTNQGFPESYKAGLRLLHIAHPNWVFKANNVGYTWSTALNNQTRNVGTNLVSPSLPSSYRSKDSKSYNSSTKTWTKFDGSWYAANKTVVAYYMDPRNFLNENGVYQFMTHQYDASSQNETTVKAVVKGSFMETRSTGSSTYKSFASLINAAGKVASVNPNVIAAMIVQEQGTKGASGLISGTYSGYKGYYNFFNIGAYTTSSMSAVQRGLWYAKQSGSYGRPWNSVYKSIKGGATFYGDNYVKKKQDTYYYKKFNMKNGATAIGTHQYMTNVSAAASEGKLLKSAFSANSSYSAVIEIPVYTSMPADACPLP